MRARATLRDIRAAHSRRRRRAKCGSDGRRGCATKVAWAIVTAAAGTGQAGGSRVGLGTRPQVRASCIAGGTSPKRVRVCGTACAIGNGSWARRWRCTLCWRCVQAGASSGENGTARKMVAACGEAAKVAWAMKTATATVTQAAVTQVVAGGARRFGRAWQEEPSRSEIVARGAGEGEDWEREQRVPRMRGVQERRGVHEEGED
ncbi:hypothetical protein C8F04DRAFT_1114549 [Mycena alexandri]|uniref:Uncharacterized protein n=1 Tax=Mycena alexandri TaxID=1745969 RepID=A0AAD6SM43_9AGAR|nr:hypothetical protein C8F04DRAFT_1114549 [Mycena alexandri]